MLKKIISRHVISNRGRHSSIQRGTIVLVLECTHATLGTQTEDSTHERVTCHLCAADNTAAQNKLRELEAEIQKLRESLSSGGTRASAVAYQPPMRTDRTELKRQLLAELSGGKRATSRQLAKATGADIDAVCRTLGNMADAGQVIRAGKADDNLLLWTAAATAPTSLAGFFKEIHAHEAPQQELPVA